MALPTNQELNGRTLYIVLSEHPREGAIFTAYVGTDEDQAREVARKYLTAIVAVGRIAYDAREAGEE